MSALIPMTKLPDNCAIGGRDGLGCPCFCTWNDMCQLLGETVHTAYFKDEKRPERCPLQFVQPHGRLIDADALKDVQQADADLFKGSSDYGEKCRYDEAINAVANIVNAPTIIPAEEG